MTAHKIPAERLQAAARCLVAAAELMYGVHGESVEEAVEAAWTPTGPSREELRERITRRRAELRARARRRVA